MLRMQQECHTLSCDRVSVPNHDTSLKSTANLQHWAYAHFLNSDMHILGSNASLNKGEGR